MKNKITYLITAITVMALSSCAEERLMPPHPDGKEGESVKVELNFRIPPASIPNQVQSRGTTVNASKNTIFSVDYFQESYSAETRSEASTALYNLWLFQFNADGTVHGLPQVVSDQTTMVNDMALLSATLHVGTDQTIYLVALGKKVTATGELAGVRTINDLEAMQLDYVDNRSGLYYSRITSEDDIPYAGAVRGVTVRKLNDNDDSGEIVYNTPDGFAGGIEIRRLIARITLKYKFELTNNKLEGIRLLKVPAKLLIDPSSVGTDAIEAIPMADLESENAFNDADQDTDGFFTSQWYVAQNKQGTVAEILTEKDRYRKVNATGTSATGYAPEPAMNIEAWSYAKSKHELYTVHQIYVGNNNTDNFDVETNSYYNIRTVINSDDTGDGRIRSYTSKQQVYLSSANESTHGGAGGETDIYFDAHYGWRPVIIDAQGRKVMVGIYRDEGCTQLVDMNNPAENWLQLSAYPNYTEVVRNGGKAALTNEFETNIFLPTRFKLYLYADEYITNEDGSITQYNLSKDQIYATAISNGPTTTTFLKDRALYVKIITEEIAAEGVPKKLEAKYAIKQKQGYYTGLFGGEIVDGQYSKGLIVDGVDEYRIRYDNQYPSEGSSIKYNYLFFAYSGVFTGYVWSKDNDVEENYKRFVNGKQATYDLATNPDNYQVNKNLEGNLSPMRKVNGHIDLYQYTYFESFQARYCHDMNRDKNGNGVIDYFPDDPEKNELEWYLPSTYQAYGIFASAGTIKYGNMALAFESGTTSSPGYGLDYGPGSNSSKTSWKGVRCVRDIPVPNEKKEGTKATTYTTESGDSYAMIDLTNLPNGIADRTTPEGKEEIYEELDLYSYSTKGELYDEGAPQADASKPLGKKVVRMIKNQSTNVLSKPALAGTFCSRKFIVSPTDVYNDGDVNSNTKSEILKDANDTPRANSNTMTWAEANGRLNTANSQGINDVSQAMLTGCYAYKGKNGTDEPGSWRTPNIQEMSMIWIFAHDLVKSTTITGFKLPALGTKELYYYDSGYWSSSQGLSVGEAAWGGFDKNYSISLERRGGMTSKHKLRCIKDIP